MAAANLFPASYFSMNSMMAANLVFASLFRMNSVTEDLDALRGGLWFLSLNFIDAEQIVEMMLMREPYEPDYLRAVEVAMLVKVLNC